MRTLIRHIGLARSGTHAILNWIQHQYEADGYKVSFFNNADQRKVLDQLTPGLPLEPNDAYRAEKSLILIGVEDKLIYDLAPVPDRVANAFARRFDVVLLRDPFNHLASRFNHRDKKKVLRDKIVNAWIQYAYEFSGHTNFLGRHKLPINYNLWNADREYREQLATELGVPFNDETFDTMLRGFHSSFDDNNVGAAIHERVMGRWQQMQGDADYVALFRGQDELYRMSESIFGPMPGTEVMRG